MQTVDHPNARNILYGGLAASYLLTFAGLAFSKVSIEPSSADSLIAVLAVVFALFGLSVVLKFHRLSNALETMIVGIFLLPPVVAWTYMAVGVGLPAADARLAEMDAALGFDWKTFIGFVEQRYHLAKFLGFSYASFLPQIFFLPVYFCLIGRPSRAYAIVFGYGLICLLASIVSIWYPATGAFVFYGVGPQDTVNINSAAAFSALEQFRAVHEQPSFLLRFDEAAGILTFPSVHAAVAGLCAWAAWDSKALRHPFLVLNVGMAVSTISAGSHYLVDVIGGLGLTGLSVAVATALFLRPSDGRSVVLAFGAGIAARVRRREAAVAAIEAPRRIA